MRLPGIKPSLEKLAISAILVFLVAGFTSLPANDHKMLSGIVVSQQDSTGIPGVHVINLSREVGTSSSADGSFGITIMKGDSIMFQAMGYISDTLIVTEDFFKNVDRVTVRLQVKIYEISGVDVHVLPPYDEFRRNMIYFGLSDTIPDLWSNLRDLKGTSSPIMSSGAPTISFSPISFIYNRFSREGKELRKYSEILQQENLRNGWTFNYELVRKITGFEEDEEILAFLDFCDLSSEVLTELKEFEVTEVLLNCYKKYVNESIPVSQPMQ